MEPIDSYHLILPGDLQWRPSKQRGDMRLFYPVDPTQLPRELAGVAWPPS